MFSGNPDRVDGSQCMYEKLNTNHFRLHWPLSSGRVVPVQLLQIRLLSSRALWRNNMDMRESSWRAVLSRSSAVWSAGAERTYRRRSKPHLICMRPSGRRWTDPESPFGHFLVQVSDLKFAKPFAEVSRHEIRRAMSYLLGFGNSGSVLFTDRCVLVTSVVIHFGFLSNRQCLCLYFMCSYLHVTKSK